MKLNELAKRVGKSAPYVMVLQKKFGMPGCKDYPDGYAILVKKLIYLFRAGQGYKITTGQGKESAGAVKSRFPA